MRKYSLAFLAIFCLQFVQAQNDCIFKMECTVSAPSGMRMRAEPNLKAAVVTGVPYDSALVACTESFGRMEYEGIEGHWRKVQYRNKVGYMFDGFLRLGKVQDVESVESPEAAASRESEKMKPSNFALLTETYNYCGDVSAIDPGLLWYGIYPKEEEGENYRLKRIEVNVVLSKQKIGQGLEFDVVTEEEERSIFLLGTNRPLEIGQIQVRDNSEALRMAGRRVFPGQQSKLGSGSKSYLLSATGNVLKGGDCPEIQNYKLMLKAGKSTEAELNLAQLLHYSGGCGMPELYWHGDLNGDGWEEIIIVQVFEGENRFTLLMSSEQKGALRLEQQAVWSIKSCE